MSERYFTDYNPLNVIKPMIEADRVIDIRDAKWAHPEYAASWVVPENGVAGATYDQSVSEEERANRAIAATQAIFDSLAALDDPDAPKPEPACDVTTYTAPGCPEEPDVPVEVVVYRPKSLTKKKARTLFFLMGGGLVMREPSMFGLEDLCVRLDCVIVVPLFRRAWEAKYPAAMNDCHAAYQWMLDNAEVLRIHPDNVVINGSSSGGHLACALGFRLKRYGIVPKGIVAMVPQVDERQGNGLPSRFYNGYWDAANQHDTVMNYLGLDFGSSYLGPEALANRATVSDCVGYPPLFIHTGEFDPDRDFVREFYSKVQTAMTFTEFYCWAGTQHDIISPWHDGDHYKMINGLYEGQILECWKYDLRRPWVVEDLKENGPWW